MMRHLMKMRGNRWGVSLTAMAVAAGLAGCAPADMGPRHTDYKAAHTPHYHPDVRREADGTTTRPAASTQPSDFRFSGGPSGTPILFVNSEAITVPQVLEPLYDDLAKAAKSLSETAYRDYLIRQVAREITDDISGVIIFQEAKRSFPDKADEAFAKEADRIITENIDNRYGGVRARYEEHLKAVGITGAEAKEQIKRRLMIAQYLHDHFKPLLQNPARAELLKYYQGHKTEFTTAAKAEMFIIEIPFESELQKQRASSGGDVVAAARADGLAKIRRAREELESGVEFAEIARQYSKGLQAARGGAVGEVSPGSMAGRYQRACEVLFTLAEGRVSEPVETPDAVFLVKCGKKTAAHQGSFEESQGEIRAKLMEQQYQELQHKYVQEMQARSVIGNREEFMMAVLSAAPRPPQYDVARPGASK